MKQLGIVCRVRMKKYHSYKGEVGKIALNLLERNFEAEKPNQKWVTDVTEFSLFGQKLYLSPILDLCSRDIVSYSISDKPVLQMVTEMLGKAFVKIPDGTNLILHSDQGWQYQHKHYQRMLRGKGIRQYLRTLHRGRERGYRYRPVGPDTRGRILRPVDGEICKAVRHNYAVGDA